MMNWLICSLLFLQLKVKVSMGQNCLQPGDSQRGIPLEDLDHNSDQFPRQTQAIVTSYQFHCCGDITNWKAFVEPDDSILQDGHYTIHFQVWRPSPTVESDGCYSMVGENRFTNLTFSSGGLVDERPPFSEMIAVQPGDVVGFYVSTPPNSSRGLGVEEGIQLISRDYTQESIWYHTSTDEDPLVRGSEACPLPVGPTGVLQSYTVAAPALTAEIATTPCPVLHQTSSTTSPPSLIPQATPPATPTLDVVPPTTAAGGLSVGAVGGIAAVCGFLAGVLLTTLLLLLLTRVTIGRCWILKQAALAGKDPIVMQDNQAYVITASMASDGANIMEGPLVTSMDAVSTLPGGDTDYELYAEPRWDDSTAVSL